MTGTSRDPGDVLPKIDRTSLSIRETPVQLHQHAQIVRWLGGGMGGVYAARDTELDELVALKFCGPACRTTRSSGSAARSS